jgi:hypothetical protein
VKENEPFLPLFTHPFTHSQQREQKFLIEIEQLPRYIGLGKLQEINYARIS